MFIRAYTPGGRRSRLTIKAGNAELIFYGSTLLGVRTPDGTWRLDEVSYQYNTRERKVLREQMLQAGLLPGWVAPLVEDKLKEKAGNTWLSQYAQYARERMIGGESLCESS
jgi:hypothetical protein